MDNIDSTLCTIGIYAVKPLCHTWIELYIATTLLKSLTTQRDTLCLRLTNHQRHIGQNLVSILLLSKVVCLTPKLLIALSDSRNKVVLLHIAGSQCAVKIVN